MARSTVKKLADTTAAAAKKLASGAASRTDSRGRGAASAGTVPQQVSPTTAESPATGTPPRTASAKKAPAAKKGPAKKAPAPEETATGKAAAKAPAAKRTAAANGSAGSPTAVKPAAKKAAAKKAAPQKAAPQKAAPQKAAPQKAAAKTAAAKTTAAKRPAAKKAAPQKAAARPAKRASAAKTGANRTAGAGVTARTAELAVKPEESPWTAEELDGVRTELLADVERLRVELDIAERELDGLMRDAGDGAGHDQADVGSTTFERDHELSLANNARHMLTQSLHALERIEDGSYGVCESCGLPVGKNRLMAFPRATLCLTCKQREERR